MTKRAIPRIPPATDPDTRIFMDAVKERLETISGARGAPIAKLDAGSATTAQIIAKVNELIALLQ